MTKSTKRYKINADELFQNVKEVCERQNYSIIEEDTLNRRLKANSGWSAFSWGETMEIIISQLTNGSTITVECKPNIWFNLTAENKVERNIKNLFEELGKKNKRKR